MAKNIIFDFDGTLADTLDLAIEFGNANQARFSKRVISKDDFKEHSMREALKRIGLPLRKLPQFVFELKKYLSSHLQRVQLFPGIVDMIEDLSKKGNKLYIMSSNSAENISAVLERHSLSKNFSAIHSDSSIFGKHRVLARMLPRYNFNTKDTIYVGDEVRDFEACVKCGIEMIAVAWGWNSVDRLKKSGIEKVATSIEEIKTFL